MIVRKSGFLTFGAVAAGLVAAVVTLAPLPLDRGEAMAQEGMADGGLFRIDANHSTVMFRIKHLNVANFYGRFNVIDGGFMIDPDNLAESEIDVVVKTASVDTNDDGRDKHLKSPDFFNAKVFPIASFKSKSIEKVGEGLYEATGDFTMSGVKKKITVPVELTGEGPDPWGNYRAGFETTFTLSRKAFGITYLPEGLGDTVQMTVSLEGMRPNS